LLHPPRQTLARRLLAGDRVEISAPPK